MKSLREYGEMVFELEEEAIADNDMKMKFIGFKENVPRVYMFPGAFIRDDREKIYWAVQLLCSTVDFDTLIFVSDTYGSNTATKKNGERWGAGEMQYAWENDTEDKELVHEQLQVTVATREGRIGLAAVPYRRMDDKIACDLDEGEYHWEGDKEPGDEDKDGLKMGGLFPNAMRDGMARPNIFDDQEKLREVAKMMQLDEERARIHIMCAGVKMIVNEGMPVAIGALGDLEKEIVDESFQKGHAMMENLHAEVINVPQG